MHPVRGRSMDESLVRGGSQPQRGLGTTVTYRQTKLSAPRSQTEPLQCESSSWPRAGRQ